MVAPIVVLGTGMAAMGAGHVLETNNVAFETFDRYPHAGGHTATYVEPGGWFFDDGPHVSFTKNEHVQEFLAANVDGAFESVQMRIDNLWRGHLMKHPVQCNLYGLPTDLVVDVIRDFVSVHDAAERPIRTYADWLDASYGPTFAQTFPTVYGLKYHTTTPDNMTTEWLGPRMYRPDLDEVLRGALGPTTSDHHYVTHFRYPTYGGFYSYLRPFWERNVPRLEHELVALAPDRRTVRFGNGVETTYSEVISSIPLPDLIPRIEGAPERVLEAARTLAFTTVVIVDLGIDRADLSDVFLRYVYDPEIIFPRVNFPHLLSPKTVPVGKGSIQAEVYFSAKYRPLDQPIDGLVDRVIADLKRIGILTENDRILHRRGRVTKYANVIYDLERAAALSTVHAYLDEIGVRYCGRYGDWDHAWTDEAFVSGERAAHAALESTMSAGRA